MMQRLLIHQQLCGLLADKHLKLQPAVDTMYKQAVKGQELLCTDKRKQSLTGSTLA